MPGDSSPLLAQLAPYQDPSPVGWWPPAPGWWVLAALVLVACGLLASRGWHRWRRRALAREARREIVRLRRHVRQDGDASGLVRALARLLRQVALARFPRDQVASLHGEAWLDFLDRHGGNGGFREGAGAVLGDGPYRREVGCDAEALLRLVEDWVRRNGGRR